jgi:hypothetical protein
MPADTPDFREDDKILEGLKDPLDLEAFSNLMAHAHAQGISAADFVRQDPKRTSRKNIKKLCLKDRRRSLRAQIAMIVKHLWERPAQDPESAYIHSLYSPAARPPEAGKNGQQGKG